MTNYVSFKYEGQEYVGEDGADFIAIDSIAYSVVEIGKYAVTDITPLVKKESPWIAAMQDTIMEAYELLNNGHEIGALYELRIMKEIIEGDK